MKSDYVSRKGKPRGIWCKFVVFVVQIPLCYESDFFPGSPTTSDPSTLQLKNIYIYIFCYIRDGSSYIKNLYDLIIYYFFIIDQESEAKSRTLKRI